MPPITVSNPSENLGITEKIFDMSPTADTAEFLLPAAKNSSKEEPIVEAPCEPRKGLVRELLAFVRKPSKKTATRTGKFAAAFSRAESNSATPLMRQSTFTSSPRASSGAAKTAVTKQLSLSILNSKMSFRLRRTVEKVKEKISSGEEVSDLENDPKVSQFELEKIRFEKVGESYIKHEKIREETEDSTPSPVNIDTNVGQSDNQIKDSDNYAHNKNDDNNANGQLKVDKNLEPQKTQQTTPQTTPHENYFIKEQNTSVDSIKEDGITINNNLPHATDFTIDTLKTALEHFVLKPEPVYARAAVTSVKDVSNERSLKSELQCPTFEIMPPSRRSSFDPPRSPYLENLRSPCDTDPETMNLTRLDSDSFEMIDTDRNHESSFESRYPSSSHTSFDISRYQSEDQTSSFEIINDDRVIDIRKSSIELVDVSTFNKSSGRKSSLETHFDFEPVAVPIRPDSELPASSRLSMARTKKQVSEPNKQLGMKNHYSTSRSLLLNQTSSNYSSRDSHDSYSSTKWHQQHSNSTTSPQRSPFADPSKQHFPIFSQSAPSNETKQRFICTDQRCASIFEPRPYSNHSTSYLSSHLTSSSEFEPPSPRRAASASPKHTFTFRIVLKKVDSSPDALCPSTERRRSKDRTDRIRRRDSRKKRFWETGKSF